MPDKTLLLNLIDQIFTLTKSLDENFTGAINEAMSREFVKLM